MRADTNFEETAEYLRLLAEKYETAEFTDGDPSRILRRYDTATDAECASFIGAMLAFGRRDQFLAKTDYILEQADKSGGPAQWLSGRAFRSGFVPPGINPEGKFYRFYSWNDMLALFERLGEILRQSSSLGEHIRSAHERKCRDCAREDSQPPHLAETLCQEFSGCRIVPQGKDSANKRVHMFLRWMVRRNSPVDLGLWTWYDSARLLIPLDTHVIQESVRLGLLPEKASGTARTARLLTEKLSQIWPDDPCRGDYALFGLGVDSERSFS